MTASFKKKGRMSSQSREMTAQRKHLLFLAMQVLEEENCMDAAHILAQESGIYLNMKYLEQEVMNGHWDEVEKYICRFTKCDDNSYSRKIFWDIRQVKYLETVEKHDWENAVEILAKDLSVFASTNDYSYEQLTQLTPDNFRENKMFAKYNDTKSIRATLFAELKKSIEENPLLSDKLRLLL